MAILTSSKMRKIRALAAFITLLLWFAPARADDTAQPLQLYEEKIKAGLVYSFLKYTNWPPDILARSHNNLQVCLLGDEAFDNELNPLQGRTVQQYTIAIAHINSAVEAENCSMVFIHRNQENNLPDLIRNIKGKHVLTVSDIDQFNRQGGMVEFSTEDHHVGFSINKKALDQAGFSIQSRLLRLAKADSEQSD